MEHVDQANAGEAAALKAQWVKPQVDQLVAGGAEAGGATSTDGIDILS